MREMKDISQELEWKHMERHQPGPAATGSGGLCTDDTTLIESVEPSSFDSAGDRLAVHLSSSKSTACLGDVRTPAHSSNVPVEKPEQVERETTSQNGVAKTLEFEAWPDFQKEIESAKSHAG